MNENNRMDRFLIPFDHHICVNLGTMNYDLSRIFSPNLQDSKQVQPSTTGQHQLRTSPFERFKVNPKKHFNLSSHCFYLFCKLCKPLTDLVLVSIKLIHQYAKWSIILVKANNLVALKEWVEQMCMYRVYWISRVETEDIQRIC